MIELYQQTMSLLQRRGPSIPERAAVLLEQAGRATRGRGAGVPNILELDEPQIFDVSNVVDWLVVMAGAEQLDTSFIEQLPCCTPRYPRSYFEWNYSNYRWAAEVIAVPGAEGQGYSAMLAFLLLRTPQAGLIYLGTAVCDFDESGKVSTRDAAGDLSAHIYLPKDVPRSEVQKDWVRDSWQSAQFILLFALSLFHCRNVYERGVNPADSLSRQRRRALERSGELVLYKELVVKPIHKRARSSESAAGESTRGAKRAHLVSGHFAEYGPAYGKGLLFGKYEGRYFIPPMVRGSLDQGAVFKTYKLSKPAQEGRVA